MSKYTTEIRYICENAAGLTESAGYSQVNQIIQTAAPNIFDFTFPIFDETYRLPLEIKILRHYYTKEICEETVALWKLRLEDRMNMIMPYYNQLYRSALLEFNPLYDIDVTREHTTDFTGVEDTNDIGTDTMTIQDTAETHSTETRELNKEGTNENTENEDTTGTNTKTIASEVNGETHGGSRTIETHTETGTVDTTETNTAESDVTGSNNLSVTTTRNDSVVRAKEVAETDTDNNTKTIENDTTNASTKTTSDDTDTTTTETGSNTENSTQWDLYSDTPQGGIVGIANASDDIANNAYLTNARKITNDKSAQSSLTATGTAERDISETQSGTGTLDQTDTFAGTKGIDIDEDETTTTTGRDTNLETGSKTESTESTANKTVDTDTSNSASINKNTFDDTESTEETNTTESVQSTSNRGNTKTGEWTETNDETNTASTMQTNTGRHVTEQAKTGNKNVANLEEYVEHVRGKQGGNSFSAMLMEFRQTFLNIDKLLIDELSDLFFGLWA